MRGNVDALSRVALGAAGGFAGTMVLQALMAAGQKWRPDTLPPLRQDPSEFLVERAEDHLPEAVRGRIPDAVETGAARALAVGYGLAFGALYAAFRPRGGNPLLEGAALGVACWAVGYAGWLPALGLMPPVWRQRAQQAVAPAAEHVAYGVATVVAYNWLRRRAGQMTA
jgi:hypothetical protein